jgi:hypothetical protein
MAFLVTKVASTAANGKFLSNLNLIRRYIDNSFVIDGFGELHFPDGAIYTGQFVKGLMSGRGRMQH